MSDTLIEQKPANPKADEWAERIAAQQRSGMSVKQFCKEHGLTEYSFYAWRKRLQEKGPVRYLLELQSEVLPKSPSGAAVRYALNQWVALRRLLEYGELETDNGATERANRDIALARQKECQILEGHLMPDHVHMCIAIPPKHPVASGIGFLKGKSAVAIARLYGKERNFSGEHFWARGYAVSTVGFELE